MTKIGSPFGVFVEEEWETLNIRHKDKPNAGIAMVGLSLAFGLPIGGFLLLSGPISDDNLSFVCVFGPILGSVFLLGVRALINSTIMTASKTQLMVKVQPLPLWPAKRVPVADLRSLEIKVKKTHGKSGTHITYALVAHHRDGSTTNLMKFNDFDFKDAVYFVKDLLEKKFGL